MFHVCILVDVLRGLHSAHELRDFDGKPLNVVHRDASPQNVMLTFAGGVKVLDFGIAKAARSARRLRDASTHLGSTTRSGRNNRRP